MARLPPGIRFIISFSRDQWYRAFIFILTFLLYASFHLSRKPISIVKGELHRFCTAPNEGEVHFHSQSQKAGDTAPHRLPGNGTDCGWAPFDQDNYQQLLGALDYAFLCAYAVGMYLSGVIGERLPIRYYLTAGMLASGALTALFGLGYFYDIHSFGFYVVTQVVNGLVQTTGWPSVVTCLGNWFGKGRRGLIMGVWNSHTSVGNILGSLIAGFWVSTCWGLSFIVPGAIVAAMGIVCFLFLIEHPKDIACSSTLVKYPKAYENGAHRFRLQKQVLTDERSKPLPGSQRRLRKYTKKGWARKRMCSGEKVAPGPRGCTLDLLPGRVGYKNPQGPRDAVLTAVGRKALRPPEPRGHSPGRWRGRHGRHQLHWGLENPWAALGPLLAGLISPSGWSNVFYMLMFADACALLFLIRLIHKELSCPGLATGDQVPFKEH
ncbi:glucose-6-phosphate exchanger SLC37A1 isoform X4 [Camelus ferus]|uniref:Glucose-6-phosphate exchanger SLC37A1 isoform X4 n=1 Tax=Camelus ferus TaxID=419612 RepID=A0A8B8RAP6_CAMFR|nr:glucose-6-phosphate exchanger SLC37A1 isoform X4 [Camelus ferus]